MRCSPQRRLRSRSCRFAAKKPGAVGANCLDFGTKWHQVTMPGRPKLLILWWAQQDSNLRLPPCEGGTLPLSYAPLISQQKTMESSGVQFFQRISFIARLG
jgi:hypothetical protein